MKAKIVSLLAVLTISLAVCGQALAHHSMSMYDHDHDTTFKATIVQFAWANPHAQIIFEAPDDHGNVVRWTAEGPGPNRLGTHGLSKDTLKPGDQVTIVGNVNKDGSPTMGFKRIVLANGQTLEARPRGY